MSPSSTFERNDIVVVNRSTGVLKLARVIGVVPNEVFALSAATLELSPEL